LWHGKGVGADLLKRAMRRTVLAADISGIGACGMRAKDNETRGYHEHFGFIAVPMDRFDLFVLVGLCDGSQEYEADLSRVGKFGAFAAYLF
jgi:hypothetical protein